MIDIDKAKLQADLAIAEVKALWAYLWYKGGPGSGNWGHAGRPGHRGGSSRRGGGMATGGAAGGSQAAGGAAGRRGDINAPTVRTGVVGTAGAYNEHVQLAKDIFNALPPEAQAKIRETEARIKAGTQTIDKYMDADGKWDADRVKLHDRIVDSILGKATPVDNPEVVVTGGLPGSGKSTVLKARGKAMTNHVHVDSDAVKSMLPEYEGWNAALLHEEATHIVSRIIERSVADRKNVIYDATLKSADSSSVIIKAFAANGYKSKVVFVDVPMKTAMTRAMDRFLGPTNRYVPLDYLATHDSKNVATLEKLKGQVDEWEHWDNSQPHGQPPTLKGKG